MQLKILDMFACPRCVQEGKSSDRKYLVKGDFNEIKIFDGFIECSNNHRWQIRDELLKFDEMASSEYLYSPYDIEYKEISPIPPNVTDFDSFLVIVKMATKKAMSQGKIIAVFGFPINFLESLDAVDRPLIVVNENEAILRKSQEIAAKNGFFDFLTVVKAKSVVFNNPDRIFQISILDENVSSALSIRMTDDGSFQIEES